MAGIIAAIKGNGVGVVGVAAGNVNLFIVRIFDNRGNFAYSSDIVDAARRCRTGGANIINMSLGSARRPSKTEKRALDELAMQGVLILGAAGNGGTSACFYPSAYPSVVSVGAVDQSGTVWRSSGRHVQAELTAPGVGIRSTSNPTYASRTGTSSAVPHVSGVAALIWSHHPTCSAAQIRDVLACSALDLGTPGRDSAYGYGLVQARAALDRLNAGGCNVCTGFVSLPTCGSHSKEPKCPQGTRCSCGGKRNVSGFIEFEGMVVVNQLA